MKFGWIAVLVCAAWFVAKFFVAFSPWVHLAGILSGLLGIFVLYRSNSNSSILNAVSEMYLTLTVSGSLNLFGAFLGLSFLTFFVALEQFNTGFHQKIHDIPALWLVIGLRICWWIFTLYAVLLWKRWKRRKEFND